MYNANSSVISSQFKFSQNRLHIQLTDLNPIALWLDLSSELVA